MNQEEHERFLAEQNARLAAREAKASAEEQAKAEALPAAAPAETKLVAISWTDAVQAVGAMAIEKLKLPHGNYEVQVQPYFATLDNGHPVGVSFEVLVTLKAR